MTVDEVVAADRQYFDEYPDEDEYIREFMPGQFEAAELPRSRLPERYQLLCDTAWRLGSGVL